MRQGTAGRRGANGLSIAAAALAAAAAAAGRPATAATDNWANAAGGTWTAGANWSLGTPPAVTDDAVFNLSAAAATTAYTVTLPGTENPNSLAVRNNSVTFTGGSLAVGGPYQTYLSLPNFGVMSVTAPAGGLAQVTLASMAVNPAVGFSVGDGTGTAAVTLQAAAIVSGNNVTSGLGVAVGSSLSAYNKSTVSIGNLGGISIAGTAQFFNSSIGVVNNDPKPLLVSGGLGLNAGSTGTASEVVIGNPSAATTADAAAAVVDASSLSVGGPIGILSIGGGTFATTFGNGVTTSATPSGPGQLIIQNGGTVSTPSAYVGSVGTGTSGAGFLGASGAGSKLTLSLLDVGAASATSPASNGGTGTVIVRNGASLVTGTAAYVGGSGGTGSLTVSGAGTTWTLNAGQTAQTFNAVLVGTDATGRAGTGTLQIDTNAAATINGTVTVAAGGRLNVISGGTLTTTNLDLSAAGGFNLSGGTVRLGGGTLTDAALTLPATATLGGSGTLTGTLANLGTVAPGVGTATFGRLGVGGAYSQSTAATLDIVLGGTTAAVSYDQLAVAGAASLAGTLDVSAAPAFAPSLGQSFDVITFASESGRFGTVNLPPLSPGLAWDTSRLYADGTIAVAAVPEPATLGLAGVAAAGLLGRRSRRRPA